jgi:hypothetical protein
MKKAKVIIFLLTIGIAITTMLVVFRGLVIVGPPAGLSVELTRGYGWPLAYDLHYQACIGTGCPSENVFNYFIFIADAVIWTGLIYLLVSFVAKKKQKSFEDMVNVSGKLVVSALLLAVVTVGLTEFLYRQFYTMYLPIPRLVTVSVSQPCPDEGAYVMAPDSSGCGFTEQISYFNVILDIIVYVVVWYFVLMFAGKIINRILGNKKTIDTANPQ